MPELITMRELTSYILRKGKLLLLFGIILAILLGVGSAIDQTVAMFDENNTPEALAENYQQALEEYNQKKKETEWQVQILTGAIASQEKYLQSSPLMELNPYQVVTTTITLSILYGDEINFSDIYKEQGLSEEFMTTKIQKEYDAQWSGTNLSQVLGNETEDAYWRDVTAVKPEDGGLVVISVHGKTQEESLDRAETVYKYLCSLTKTVSTDTYQHTLRVINRRSKTNSNSTVESIQKNAKVTLKTLQTQLDVATNELEELKEPSKKNPIGIANIAISSVKSMVIGFVLGIVCGVIWIVLHQVYGAKLTHAGYLKRVTGAPLLANMSSPSDLWNKLADKFFKEQTCIKSETAFQNLSEKTGICIKEKKIILLTTLPITKTTEPVAKIIETLSKQGNEVTFFNNAAEDLYENLALTDSPCIVLIERCGKSSCIKINQIVEAAEQCEKPIRGFILI